MVRKAVSCEGLRQIARSPGRFHGEGASHATHKFDARVDVVAAKDQNLRLHAWRARVGRKTLHRFSTFLHSRVATVKSDTAEHCDQHPEKRHTYTVMCRPIDERRNQEESASEIISRDPKER